MKRWLALRRIVLAIAFIVSAGVGPSQARDTVESIAINARPIDSFQIGFGATTFGPLEFVGGLELTSDAGNFGALSAFRFLSPGSEFIGVADTGFWFFGRIEHDAAQKPSGLTHFTAQQFVDGRGRRISEKRQVDAEGLAVRNGVATVGFERQHRIVSFRIDPSDMKPPFGDIDFLVPKNELRQNRGFEALAYAPVDSPLQGALVAVSEKSLDRNGNVFAAVLDGPRKGIFTVSKDDRFDITDGAFLPNGDLLLLERAFSMSNGVAMRLRRIPGNLITKDAEAVDGMVLLEVGMAYQIDNMEAMDIWQRVDGATMVSLMSDDNQSILQRNLYLEFRLAE